MKGWFYRRAPPAAYERVGNRYTKCYRKGAAEVLPITSSPKRAACRADGKQIEGKLRANCG
jgi:hypothetical protein